MSDSTELSVVAARVTRRLDELVGPDGRWSGRELMPEYGYDNWQNFREVIGKAGVSCRNGGDDPDHHFTAVSKVMEGGRWGTQSVEDFSLTEQACILIGTVADGRKAEVAAIHMYMANKLKEVHDHERRQVPVLPQSYAAALRELASTVEERDAAKAAVEELTPPAEAWRELAQAEGDNSVADAAKILTRDLSIKIGRDRLFTVLSELKWIYREQGDGAWHAYQNQINLGRLSVLPQSHYHPRTGGLVWDPPQIRVTPKGLEYLHSHLRSRPKG